MTDNDPKSLCQCGHIYEEHSYLWHVPKGCPCIVFTPVEPQTARSEANDPDNLNVACHCGFIPETATAKALHRHGTQWSPRGEQPAPSEGLSAEQRELLERSSDLNCAASGNLAPARIAGQAMTPAKPDDTAVAAYIERLMRELKIASDGVMEQLGQITRLSQRNADAQREIEVAHAALDELTFDNRDPSISLEQRIRKAFARLADALRAERDSWEARENATAHHLWKMREERDALKADLKSWTDQEDMPTEYYRIGRETAERLLRDRETENAALRRALEEADRKILDSPDLDRQSRTTASSILRAALEQK